MAYEYKKLKGRITELFGTRQKFAEKLCLSSTSLSLKLNGKTSFSQSDITMWSEILGITPDEYGSYFFA